ncbi:MAG: hypothetical protein ACTSSG_14495 [Candidatus Heimdallarchaeaceae archaeon]
MEMQDFINFEPKPILFIKEPAQMDVLFNSNYEPIIITLREGHLTFKEIVERYSELSERERSDVSIHRYLKELIDFGLVIESGQRFTTGKTVTEKLYSRTAKIFFPLKTPESYWKEERGNVLLSKITEVLRILFNDSKPSVRCVKKMISTVEFKTNTILANMLEENYEEISKVFEGLSFSELNILFNFVSSIILLKSPELYEKLLTDCFSSK